MTITQRSILDNIELLLEHSFIFTKWPPIDVRRLPEFMFVNFTKAFGSNDLLVPDVFCFNF